MFISPFFRHPSWLALPFILVATAAMPAADTIFASGFDRSSLPAGTIEFRNETSQRFDHLADSAYRFDAMWTDFNGDGCPDAWIFGHEDPSTSRLWVNRCDGSNTFVLAGNDVVHYYIGTPLLPRGTGWVTLLDVDGDGRQDFWTRDADTMAARYVNGTPSTAAGSLPSFSGKDNACEGGDHCVLADINGDDRIDVVHEDGSIRDALTGLSLSAATTPGDRAPADLDGDGWIDLVQPDAGGYWHNNHGNLEWRAIPGLAGNTELILVQDLDNDGDYDIFTLGGDNATGEGGPHLYRNNGNTTFTDVTAASGLAATMPGPGDRPVPVVGFTPYFTNYGNVVVADLDNDGLQDLVIAGNKTSPSVTVLRNLGDLRFGTTGVNLGDAASGSDAAKSRAATADFDNDGRLDILKTQADSNVGLWRNTTNTGSNHWMKVRVRGTGGNSDGIGADLTWYAAGTDTILAHMSVQASNQHPQTWLHTGVGDNAQVDLVVHWPHGGPVQRYDDLATNQEVIVFPEPAGCILQHWQPGDGWPLNAPTDCTQPRR